MILHSIAVAIVLIVVLLLYSTMRKSPLKKSPDDVARARDEQTWEVQPSLVPSFSLFFILSFLSFRFCLSFIFLFFYFFFIFYLFFFIFSLLFIFYLNKSEKKFLGESVCVFVYIYFLPMYYYAVNINYANCRI
jgi:hypothetical protein